LAAWTWAPESEAEAKTEGPQPRQEQQQQQQMVPPPPAICFEEQQHHHQAYHPVAPPWQQKQQLRFPHHGGKANQLNRFLSRRRRRLNPPQGSMAAAIRGSVRVAGFEEEAALLPKAEAPPAGETGKARIDASRTVNELGVFLRSSEETLRDAARP